MANVIAEEIQKHKNDGKAELMRKEDKVDFLKEWTQINKLFIDGLLGLERNNYHFILVFYLLPCQRNTLCCIFKQ